MLSWLKRRGKYGVVARHWGEVTGLDPGDRGQIAVFADRVVAAMGCEPEDAWLTGLVAWVEGMPATTPYRVLLREAIIEFIATPRARVMFSAEVLVAAESKLVGGADLLSDGDRNSKAPQPVSGAIHIQTVPPRQPPRTAPERPHPSLVLHARTVLQRELGTLTKTDGDRYRYARQLAYRMDLSYDDVWQVRRILFTGIVVMLLNGNLELEREMRNNFDRYISLIGQEAERVYAVANRSPDKLILGEILLSFAESTAFHINHYSGLKVAQFQSVEMPINELLPLIISSRWRDYWDTAEIEGDDIWHLLWGWIAPDSKEANSYAIKACRDYFLALIARR